MKSRCFGGGWKPYRPPPPPADGSGGKSAVKPLSVDWRAPVDAPQSAKTGLVKAALAETVSRPAGKLTQFWPVWNRITSDPIILSWVEGYTIEFSSPLFQAALPPQCSFSPVELGVLDALIPQLVSKGVLAPCEPCRGQFISPIFLEPKPDGSSRLILNLKGLNEFILTSHFKIEDARMAARLLTPGCFLAKLDLKDAYYLVSVRNSSRKYLRFSYHDVLYKFTCLPFGLCKAPLVFTKMLKPVLATLHGAGW